MVIPVDKSPIADEKSSFTYKMVKNTGTEMFFTNVRIYTQDESGNSYTAYDFAKDLKKGLKKGCGLDVSNKTQSLGDAFLQIN